MLGLSVGKVMDDLITYGSGLDLIERPVAESEAGMAPREVRDLVVSVLRDSRLLDHDDPDAAPLRATDRLIAIRRATDGRAAVPIG